MLETWKQVMHAYKSIDKHGIGRQITKELNKSEQNPQRKLSYTATWAVGQNIKGLSLIGCTIAVFTIPVWNKRCVDVYVLKSKVALNSSDKEFHSTGDAYQNDFLNLHESVIKKSYVGTHAWGWQVVSRRSSRLSHFFSISHFLEHLSPKSTALLPTLLFSTSNLLYQFVQLYRFWLLVMTLYMLSVCVCVCVCVCFVHAVEL